MTKDFRLLFVCMGNICRSPAAEGVMRQKLNAAGLGARVHLASAGTGGWHAGKRPDERMRRAASGRGYDLVSFARQVTEEDLADFDLVLVMDQENRRDLRTFDRAGKHDAKVRLFCDFCLQHKATQVPDPYYGGPDGFEHVLDLLEDGCDGLMNHVRERLGLS